jgi:copper resistance protein B
MNCKIQLILVLGWLPSMGAAGQQPMQPGWPPPVENDRSFGFAVLDQNELRTGDGRNTYRWEGEGWYGGNIDRVWFKTEGDLSTDSGRLEEGELQALYSHAISPFFDLQAGVRYDFEPAPSRGWAAFSVEGLAPLFFEVDASGFISDAGHYAARLEGYYDLLLTQRLVLQPQVEANFYSKSDARRGIGAGLSDLDAGLRLRYEIRREFAPYIGLAYQKSFGSTADFARQAGASVEDLRFVAGIRVWY